MECSWRVLAAFLLPLLVILEKNLSEAGCPFQNPFWFVEKPDVVSVFDENGDMVPNKIRILWGRMENFKCVDYFQVRQMATLKKQLRRITKSIHPLGGIFPKAQSGSNGGANG